MHAAVPLPDFDFQRSFHSIEGRRSTLATGDAFDLGALEPAGVLAPARWLEARGLVRPTWIDAREEPVPVLERERADGSFEAVEIDDHELLRDGVRFRVPRGHGVYRVSAWWTAAYVQRSESAGLWRERESACVPFLPPAAGGSGLEGRVRCADGRERGGAIVWLASAAQGPRTTALLTDFAGRFRTGPVNVPELLLACECAEGTAELRVAAGASGSLELRLARRGA
jgi:hypothetical protein